MKKNSREMLREVLRDRGRASRAELSRATGLSKVRVNQIVEDMTLRGELCALDDTSQSGGRPARLYAFAQGGEKRLLILLQEGEAGITVVAELVDARGTVMESRQWLYARMSSSSFIAILEPFREIQLTSVTLCTPEELRFSGVRSMVWEYCHCTLFVLGWASCFASRREGDLSIVFKKTRVPRALMSHHEHLHRCGDVSLLPMPTAWESLDYSDHTLLEEMIARLVLFLVCPLAPRRVRLLGDFWNERLEGRIRYNCKMKLRDAGALALIFLPISKEEAMKHIRHLALVSS